MTFTSAQGATIHLVRIDTGMLSAENFWQEPWLPHQRGFARTNTYGLAARVCFYTLAGSSTADFMGKASYGPAQLWSLAIPSRGDLAMFQAMLSSVGPAW